MTEAHDKDVDRTMSAARRAAERERESREFREQGVGFRLSQIGVLGWMIVIPMLLGVALGRWLDKFFDSGLFFSAPAILIGAGLGLYSAWRWMQRQ